MTTAKISTQELVDSLNIEYEDYILELKREWFSRNKRPESKDVYEVMSKDDRQKVHQYIVDWGSYVTPFAEAWWKERGFGVVWPDDDSKPMKVYKLSEA